MALDRHNQTPWVEITPPPAPAMDAAWLALWTVAAVILLALLFWGARGVYRRSGLRRRVRIKRIRGQLARRAIGAREALHAAAACVPPDALDESARRQLGRRFARHEPEAEEVLRLLARIDEGLRT